MSILLGFVEREMLLKVLLICFPKLFVQERSGMLTEHVAEISRSHCDVILVCYDTDTCMKKAFSFETCRKIHSSLLYIAGLFS